MDEQKAIEVFQKVVDLSVAGALGKRSPSCAVNPEDWPAVAHIAMNQSVLPIVGCTLLNSPELKCPDQIKNQLMEHTRMIAAQNQIKQQRIMGLIRGMEDAGIRVRLIKGYAIADCYARPECRKSEDTDLLILPEQEQAVYEYFRKQGFRVDRRNATSHHAVC